MVESPSVGIGLSPGKAVHARRRGTILNGRADAEADSGFPLGHRTETTVCIRPDDVTSFRNGADRP